MSKKPLSSIAKLGVGLAMMSIVPWLLLLVVPFLALSVGEKAIAVAVLLGVAEVMFWVGVVLAGQEVVRRYRGKLRLGRVLDWFRKGR
jgi:hypothetical protein